MAVTDVDGVRPDDDRFRHAVTAADDQVEALKVELLDEQRKQRQALAVVAADARKILKERVMDDPELSQ